MTNSRRAFQAFQERLAGEDNRPLWALGKALMVGFVGFNLLMGFMLGTVPLARNIYFHFIFHIWNPVLTWFDEMGWEGQVTMMALNAALTLSVLYVTRSYLALVIRAVVMKLVDTKNWIKKHILKIGNDGTNVAPLQPRRPPVTRVEGDVPPAATKPPPTTSVPNTDIVAG